jgi:hypothetical protein
MNKDAFWTLIEEAREAGDDCNEQAEAVMARLSELPATDILDFQRHIDACRVEAYRWDLWAVAYIVNGGCSDDGFEYFRGWLIAQGRDYYEAALLEPERAAERTEPGVCEYECEDILFGARQVYKQVAGVPMPDTGISLPSEPRGAPWSEEDLPSLFPALSERYSE